MRDRCVRLNPKKAALDRLDEASNATSRTNRDRNRRRPNSLPTVNGWNYAR